MITFTLSAGAVLESLALVSSTSSSQVGRHPEIPAPRVREKANLSYIRSSWSVRTTYDPTLKNKIK